MQNNQYDGEISLKYLFLILLRFLIKFYKWLIAYAVISGVFFFLSMSNRTYDLSVDIKSNRYDLLTAKSVVKYFQKNVLDDLRNIDNHSLRGVSKVEIIEEVRPNVNNRINVNYHTYVISIYADNPESTILGRDSLLAYLSSNTFINTRIELDKYRFNQLIQKLESETKDLEKIKNNIHINARLYSVIQEKTRLERVLRLVLPFEVIDRQNNASVKTNMKSKLITTVFIFLGMSILTAVIVNLRDLYKKNKDILV